MTDEEILKRLAEIEFGPDSDMATADDRARIAFFWNPLVNDQQCLELVKKHCLWISAPLFEGDEWGVSDYGGPEYKDTSLNHAVCFAIIQDAGVK